MILYEVLWDNGECYEDRMWSTKTFSTLEKAMNYYNKEQFAYSYHTETLTLSSFDEDDERQQKTKIAERVIPSAEEEDIYGPYDDYLSPEL